MEDVIPCCTNLPVALKMGIETMGSLILSGSTLFGTTVSWRRLIIAGMIFKINTETAAVYTSFTHSPMVLTMGKAAQRDPCSFPVPPSTA